MEKIKLTQEQNHSIQEILNQPGRSKEYLLVTHTECTVLRSDKWAERHECLESLSVNDLARVLYEPNSYEVIPQFKAGESLFISKEATHTGKDEIRKITDVQNGQIELEDNWCILANSIHIRHATPEEKKRRFWEKLDRDVDEYREDDFIVDEHGDYGFIESKRTTDIYRVRMIRSNQSVVTLFEEMRLVTTAEQRLDK